MNKRAATTPELPIVLTLNGADQRPTALLASQITSVTDLGNRRVVRVGGATGQDGAGCYVVADEFVDIMFAWRSALGD